MCFCFRITSFQTPVHVRRQDVLSSASIDIRKAIQCLIYGQRAYRAKVSNCIHRTVFLKQAIVSIYIYIRKKFAEIPTPQKLEPLPQLRKTQNTLCSSVITSERSFHYLPCDALVVLLSCSIQPQLAKIRIFRKYLHAAFLASCVRNRVAAGTAARSNIAPISSFWARIGWGHHQREAMGGKRQ